MNTFVIEYDYPADSELITAVRPAHREFLKDLKNRGILIGSGPYTDGTGGALIVIRLPEPATVATARELMDNDPFHLENALSGRTFHTWNPVLNVFAEA